MRLLTLSIAMIALAACQKTTTTTTNEATNTTEINVVDANMTNASMPAAALTTINETTWEFNEKGKDPSNAANWSYVNSGLMAVYVGVDVLWSVKLHRMIDLELGFGLGIGVVFGNLIDNWVYANNNGPYTSPQGQRYSPCIGQGDGPVEGR